eukprot:2990254-Prymnesium_polylepis.1
MYRQCIADVWQPLRSEACQDKGVSPRPALWVQAPPFAVQPGCSPGSTTTSLRRRARAGLAASWGLGSRASG